MALSVFFAIIFQAPLLLVPNHTRDCVKRLENIKKNMQISPIKNEWKCVTFKAWPKPNNNVYLMYLTIMFQKRSRTINEALSIREDLLQYDSSKQRQKKPGASHKTQPIL
jgi:hypothetical protein